MFYLMGTTLEANWGTFRYNMFLLIGYVASRRRGVRDCTSRPAAPAIAGEQRLSVRHRVSGVRAAVSRFRAVHLLRPAGEDQVAGVAAMDRATAWRFLFGDWMTRAMIVASVLNYLLFFGREIWRDMKQGHRRMQHPGARAEGRRSGSCTSAACAG